MIMEPEQESLCPPREIYTADKIDNIEVDKDCISIYLENSELIEVRASLDIHEQGIQPVLRIDRAFWGKLPR